MAEVLDTGKAEADGPVLHGKLLLRAVHVRRQHADAALFAGLDVEAHLVGIAGHAVHQRRHELHRVMQFQPGRLHGDEGVGGGVGLVEGVAGEGGHFVEYVLGHLLGNAVAHRAGNDHLAVLHQAVDEVFLLLGHDVVLFLGHGAAHQVAAAVGIPGQVAHNLHHLLLIDHAAVGDVEDGLQKRRFIADAFGVVLALDVAGDGLHRPGAVEGDSSDDILEILGLHVGQKLLHARGFELEHAVGIALGNHLVHARVVQGDVLAGKRLGPGLDGQRNRVHDDVERAQAEKVHLQKAERLQRAHGELGGNHVVVGLQGHVVDHRLAGDEHPGGVGGSVAGHALQLFRRVDDRAHLLVPFIEAAQL